MTLGGTENSDQGSADGAGTVTTSPDDARIVTSDIDHFWWAYDEATPENDVKIYREEYLERGSAGLREFAQLKIGSVDNLAMKVWEHSRYYASVRSSTRSILTQEGSIRESYRKLRDLYPAARFPTVYFLIGAMNSGGITTDRGLVIGAELFGKTTSSPLDELNPWEQSVVQPVDKIPAVVAHELVHFQQRFAKETETLLERSIAEGEADFISELIAGKQINEVQHRYGEEHETRLWSEFEQAMLGSDLSGWLYNGGALAASGQPIARPADLGYFVGYKICQSYFDNASDKKKAIRDMLEIADFEKFLKDSGYGIRFASNSETDAASGAGIKNTSSEAISGNNSGGTIAVTQKAGPPSLGH